MAFNVVNVGAAVNDGTGDTLRAGGQKINANFALAVEGPAAAVVDERIVVFDGTTGRLVKQSSLSVATVVGQTSLTGSAKLPVGTDAERPTPVAGMLRFNSDSGSFEGYDGSVWGSIGGSVPGDDTQIILATQVFG